MSKRVGVIGAGIIGLSSAVRIQDSIPNVDVTVIAEKFTPNTTSDGAGGKWEPHLVQDSQASLIDEWGQVTFDHLMTLFRSSDADEVGVQLVSTFNFRRDTPETQNPTWKNTVIGYRTLTEQEIKAVKPGAKGGVFYTTLFLDSKRYLPWLMRKFQRNGGKIINKRLKSIHEIADQYDIIVNCTGLGAGQLVGDTSIKPIRGHLSKVYAPWIKHHYADLDGKDFITIIPGADGTVALGGTSHVGDWDTEVRQEDRDRIWKGCLKLVPSLQNAKVVADWVGLRPSRPTIRLDSEEVLTSLKRVTVIHCYGHSGSGITLHWGCAQDVVDLVKEALSKISTQKSKL